MLNEFNVRDVNHLILVGTKVKVDYDLLPECRIGMTERYVVECTVGNTPECNSTEFCTSELWDLNNCYKD